MAVSALAVLLVVVPVALAEGDGIEVVSQEVTSDFPDGIKFKVTAESPDSIDEIRVFLKPVGKERSTYGYLEIEPGNTVTGEHFMTTGIGASHLPPGTVVHYSFEIRDAGGRVLRTDEEEFLYMDTSDGDRQWKSITDAQGLLTVLYYGEFVENRAQEVLDTAHETLETMGSVLGITPTDPIRLVVYNNYRDMTRALPFRSQAVREGLRTEGQAYVEERVLLALISEASFTGNVSHEFTHILVAEAAGRGYARVPAWLNEGLAEYGNVDQTPFYDRALAYAVFTRRLKPLWYLDAFTGEPDEIIMYYGQGKSVVRYMIDLYGVDKMTELMTAFQRTLSADDALTEVYGFDQYGLDSEWRRAIGLEPLPPPETLRRDLSATPGPTQVPETRPTPVATPQAEATAPAVGVAAEAPPASEEEDRRTRRSCGASTGDTAGLPLDIAVLALLGTPFLALNARWGLRRYTGRLPARGLARLVVRGIRNRGGREPVDGTERLNGPWD